MLNILRSLRGLTPFIGVRGRLRSDLPSRPASDDNLGRLKPSSAIKMRNLWPNNVAKTSCSLDSSIGILGSLWGRIVL